MFWIYVRKGKAVLHNARCDDCNFGLGKSGSVDLSGKWEGPFELLEDVRPPQGLELKPCPKCQPLVDR